MATDKTSLGDRMKGYENITRNHLISRMPVILRLDGRAFHTFTRGFDKPYDKIFATAMERTMWYLCENIQGCVLGYTQSDEITLVLVDYQELNTSSWFDNNIQKMVSVAASMAAWKFVDAMSSFMYLSNQNNPSVYEAALNKGVAFDCRAFNVPKDDLLNCVLWRIKDCVRNSVQALGQAHFSHKELHKKSTEDIITMVKQKTGILWNNLPLSQKYGSFCVKSTNGFVIAEKEVNTFKNLEDFFVENNVFF